MFNAKKSDASETISIAHVAAQRRRFLFFFLDCLFLKQRRQAATAIAK
jgi:hypothetical protein